MFNICVQDIVILNILSCVSCYLTMLTTAADCDSTFEYICFTLLVWETGTVLHHFILRWQSTKCSWLNSMYQVFAISMCQLRARSEV